jgi:phosphoribosyl-AMP cyclohydrolase
MDVWESGFVIFDRRRQTAICPQHSRLSAVGGQRIAYMLKWNKDDLIPAIVQDATSGAVLMMAWMNAEALALTQTTGEAHFWSRSRQALWHKGATSGNTQRVTQILYDCDGDTLLLKVVPAGPACHTGAQSCFFREL